MTFATLLEQERAETRAWYALRQLIESCFAEATRRYDVAHKATSKAKREALHAATEYRAMRDRWKALAESLTAEQIERDAALDVALEAAAKAESLPVVEAKQPAAAWFVHESAYHTQGYGAAKYARAAAQEHADKATHYGLAAEVVQEPNAYGTKGFAVHVNTTALGVEMVNRLPAVPLREWLAACWKRGTNPRVFNPFLPHGLEEKLGVDYFGNLVEREAKQA